MILLEAMCVLILYFLRGLIRVGILAWFVVFWTCALTAWIITLGSVKLPKGPMIYSPR